MKDIFDFLIKNPNLVPLVTGIFAFLGLILTTVLKATFDWFNNQSKIRADVIVKARLDWISEFRETSSELISLSRMSIYYHNIYFALRTDEEKEKIKSKSNENYLEILKVSNKLRLYLPRKKFGRFKKVIVNTPNRDLYAKVIPITELTKEINSKMKTGYPDENSRRALIKKYNDATRDFSEECSLYLKNEWEKAKKNK